jgi:hypothetical protein
MAASMIDIIIIKNLASSNRNGDVAIFSGIISRLLQYGMWSFYANSIKIQYNVATHTLPSLWKLLHLEVLIHLYLPHLL